MDVGDTAEQKSMVLPLQSLLLSGDEWEPIHSPRWRPMCKGWGCAMKLERSQGPEAEGLHTQIKTSDILVK